MRAHTIIFKSEFKSKDGAMEIESSGEIWGKGETSRRKTKIENVLIKKRKIVRESPKLHSKWHSHFGIRNPWFLSKSTPFPSASSEYSGPVPNSLFFFTKLLIISQHNLSVFPKCAARYSLYTTCYIHPRDLPNAVLFPWDDPAAYLGFYLFV